ncbi:hypothetical protein Ade02nite_14140 [Paractinoplanes deccanensis]|uniref:Uncharacterized protein n=2 Tax=Paractinoplanes deccanensis TaxID=113561 RepID=A0ABQ3XYE6_9ACTN|nr:hypothetical protein Ade02nite_14140 [Actinoplanes deccanensis]
MPDNPMLDTPMPDAPMPDAAAFATRLLRDEARGLLTRLDQVRPFALHETMVLAAALPYGAHVTIERFLHAARGHLRARVYAYLHWLDGIGSRATAAEQQRRFVLIRLEFNAVLSQFDLFTEVITQRSEHGTGVWLSGLDVLAADALRVDVAGYEPPPVVCYLARGPGAAIRRARTRLPGGRPNPVAIIRVPRERMVGGSVASSLIHEVGHECSAQLGLVESMRRDIAAAARRHPGGRGQGGSWPAWHAWIGEILADCFAVGRLGIAGTVGLLAVVSLPAYFVFRPSGDDPHPVPYLRVLISAGIGEALYPHPQWAALRRAWKDLYPLGELPAERVAQLRRIEADIPELVDLLLSHSPAALGGRRLGDMFDAGRRTPQRLLHLHRQWAGDVGVLARRSPSLVFAVLGQAKAADLISPERESRMLSTLLAAWAVRSSLDVVQNTSRTRAPALQPTGWS